MGARKEIMVASTSKPYAAPSRPAFGGRDSGPSYGQVLHDIRNAGMISTTTTMEVSPTAANEYLCVIRAEVVMPSLREEIRFARTPAWEWHILARTVRM